MIEVRGVVKSHDEVRILDGISLSVRRGEVAALVGRSGGGKSTLLRCINGLETFDEGEVQVGEVKLTAGGAPGGSSDQLRELRRRVGIVFQHFNLFPHMTALENVCSGPRFVLGHSREQAEAEAKPLLERLSLAQRFEYRPRKLSGGQQQRVAIARALAMKPEVLLFDEPTSALDRGMTKDVGDVILELAKAGQTIVVVTHSPEFAETVADTVHLVEGGKITRSGPHREFFGDV